MSASPSMAQLELGALRPVSPSPARLAFLIFHGAHPEVFVCLVRLAREKVAAQRARGLTPRVGMKSLWERMRWDFDARPVVTGEVGPTFNNNFTAHYARLIAETVGDLSDVFEMRERRGDS